MPQKYAYLFPWSPSTRRKSATSGFWRTSDFSVPKNRVRQKKVTIAVTAKHDDRGVERLLEDLQGQTRKPDEIVIIRAEDYNNCTRAEGRNIGIKKAKYNIIAVTDVGCRPHKDWLRELVHPIENGKADVIAGFYHTVTPTPLQQAIAPFVAILPDQMTENYLPASRSIAFTKEAWKKVGGYPEEAKSAGEDLEFARRLSTAPGIRIARVPLALVDWEPPKTLEQYFLTICDHTRGNFEARITPHIIRNLTVPLRWILFFLVPQLLVLYLLWPIVKHFRQVRSFRAVLWLPIVQLVTDFGVMVGMLQ